MRRGLIDAIWAAYRDPRGAMAAEVDAGLSEARALFYLFTACALLAVASLPRAVRGAEGLEFADALASTVAAHLFGYLMLAPLLLYGLAAVAHLGARAFGAKRPFLAARMALFWAVLLGAPIALVLSLAGVVGEMAVGASALFWIGLAGYAGMAFWLWLFAASLAVAEGFSATGKVAAATFTAFAAIAVSLNALVGGLRLAG